MSTHPSKDIVGTKGMQLKNKRIVLCITGSVAAVQCPEIARTLMRHGAEVLAVMSLMAQKIIHPHLMEWATGDSVVTDLTGKIEHVALVGEYPEKETERSGGRSAFRTGGIERDEAPSGTQGQGKRGGSQQGISGK